MIDWKLLLEAFITLYPLILIVGLIGTFISKKWTYFLIVHLVLVIVSLISIPLMKWTEFVRGLMQ